MKRKWQRNTWNATSAINDSLAYIASGMIDPWAYQPLTKLSAKDYATAKQLLNTLQAVTIEIDRMDAGS